MKKIVYLCILISMCFDGMAQSGFKYDSNDTICLLHEKILSVHYNQTQQPVTPGWIYNTVYSDEFDGDTINRNKWKVYDHYFHSNHPLVGYVAENANVVNGQLVLSAYYDSLAGPFYYHGDTAYPKFISGGIKSSQKIRYGYYEVECYLPKNPTYSPCFWTIGGSAEYDEIDVFELTKETNSPYKFLQNEYSNVHDERESRTRQYLTFDDSITGKVSRFGVEVLPYEIVFYVNGHVSSHLVYNNEWADTANIFTCSDITRTVPMEIRLTFHINIDQNSYSMPQPQENFTINYFRCYKLDRGRADTYNPAVFTPSATTCKVYPHVIVGGVGHTANINTPTAIWAEQTIVFDKGFELAPWNTFSARIINHGSENPATSELYISNSPH